MSSIEFKTYIDKKEGKRFQLVRGSDEKIICFLMLNPSLADDSKDDPTIKRCLGFMNNTGHTGLIVVNLFEFITSHPKELLNFLKNPSIIKKNENDKYIKHAFKIAKTIVAAYGQAISHKIINTRAKKVFTMTDKPIYCLKKTVKGFPGHPLYLRSDSELKIFKFREFY